jgi:hypothetical protein
MPENSISIAPSKSPPRFKATTDFYMSMKPMLYRYAIEFKSKSGLSLYGTKAVAIPWARQSQARSISLSVNYKAIFDSSLSNPILVSIIKLSSSAGFLIGR